MRTFTVLKWRTDTWKINCLKKIKKIFVPSLLSTTEQISPFPLVFYLPVQLYMLPRIKVVFGYRWSRIAPVSGARVESRQVATKWCLAEGNTRNGHAHSHGSPTSVAVTTNTCDGWTLRPGAHISFLGFFFMSGVLGKLAVRFKRIAVSQSCDNAGHKY